MKYDQKMFVTTLILILIQEICAETSEKSDYIKKRSYYRPFRKFSICMGDRCLNKQELREFLLQQHKMALKKQEILKERTKERNRMQDLPPTNQLLREFHGMRNF